MDIQMIKDTQIFSGMSDKEVETALRHLSSHEKKLRKGSIVLHAGSVTDNMGLVLEGSVTIENNDLWGNRTILSRVEQGEFFAETYGFLGTQPLLVDVVANESSRILFLRIGALRSHLTRNEAWVTKLALNLLKISMQKNLMLSGRSFQTSQKTIRGRVMAYLDSLSTATGKQEFDIPFDRQQMADYLNVERTALSKELGKMKQEGLIGFRKNHFMLPLVGGEEHIS
ncbi:MAG: Crp/Fnr family transcriptional regulator [Lachnospiraceae bacterium]|nr:Crp/Fnr family transcriptional regulator [Lachnospiraceae bacterium]